MKQLGINLEWAEDWSKVEIFNDMALQCRVPGNLTTSTWANTIEPLKDAEGNIIEDFYFVMYAGRNPEPEHTHFDVYFKCDGNNPTMTYDFYPNSWDEVNGVSRLLSLTKDETTGVWKARYFLRKGVEQIILSFHDLGGKCSDIHIYRDGNDISLIYNPDYIEITKGYSCYRFMELTKCNNSTQVTWNDRTKPNEIAQGNKGIAWELVAEFCNQQKGDAWINIPHKADDNYIRQLAILMKEKLKYNQNVYVEYSNELWNGMFQQTSWLNSLVWNIDDSGDKKYSYDGNMYIWAQRKNADRCRDIALIWKEVWGQAQMNNRVRVVIGGWGAVLNHSRTHMDFLTKEYPDEPVSSYIYGIASGSYYGETNDLCTASTSEEDIFLAIRDDIAKDEIRYNYDSFKTLADNYGVKHLIYESGIDISLSNYIAKAPEDVKDIRRLHFHNNPELGNCVTEILDGYPGELFMWYKASVNDMWGFTTNIKRTDAPMLASLRRYLNKLLKPAIDIKLPTFDKKFACKKAGIMGKGFNGISKLKNIKRGKR